MANLEKQIAYFRFGKHYLGDANYNLTPKLLHSTRN